MSKKSAKPTSYRSLTQTATSSGNQQSPTGPIPERSFVEEEVEMKNLRTMSNKTPESDSSTTIREAIDGFRRRFVNTLVIVAAILFLFLVVSVIVLLAQPRAELKEGLDSPAQSHAFPDNKSRGAVKQTQDWAQRISDLSNALDAATTKITDVERQMRDLRVKADENIRLSSKLKEVEKQIEELENRSPNSDLHNSQYMKLAKAVKSRDERLRSIENQTKSMIEEVVTKENKTWSKRFNASDAQILELLLKSEDLRNKTNEHFRQLSERIAGTEKEIRQLVNDSERSIGRLENLENRTEVTAKDLTAHGRKLETMSRLQNEGSERMLKLGNESEHLRIENKQNTQQLSEMMLETRTEIKKLANSSEHNRIKLGDIQNQTEDFRKEVATLARKFHVEDSQNATKECSEQLFKRLLQVESKISELGNRSQQNEDRIGDQKNQTETIKNEVARLYQKVNTSVERFTESNEKFRLQTKDLQNTTNEHSQQLFEKLTKVESEITKLANGSAHNRNRIGRLENQTEYTRNEVDALARKCDAKAELVTESNERILNKTEDLRSATDKYAHQFSSKLSKAIYEIRKLANSSGHNKDRIGNLENQTETASTRLETLEREFRTKADLLNGNTAQITELQFNTIGLRNKTDESFADLYGKLAIAEYEIKKLGNITKDTDRGVPSMEHSSSFAKLLNETNKRILDLENEKEDQRNETNKDSQLLLEKLMKAENDIRQLANRSETLQRSSHIKWNMLSLNVTRANEKIGLLESETAALSEQFSRNIRNLNVSNSLENTLDDLRNATAEYSRLPKELRRAQIEISKLTNRSENWDSCTQKYLNLSKILEEKTGMIGKFDNATEGLDNAPAARSCSHLRESGETESGVYLIKPTAVSPTIQVFCDMASAGGGWNLVASVHENDITGKCTLGDKWSSELGRSSNSKGSMNWENYNTFGTAEGATSDDYKSPAYFDVPASDVMMWHVPNNVRITEASSRATLKYYTDTQFLTSYGGTLQSLFHQHYPMRKSTQQSYITNEDMRNLALGFNRTAYSMRSLIYSFYSYSYDFSGSVQNYIGDGGSDMFDDGNKVYYQIANGRQTTVTYNRLYSENARGEDVKVLASTSHPFSVIMWIGNPARTISSFAFKVLGNAGADGNGYYTTYSGSLTDGNYRLSYHAFIVYSAKDPSITKVFYYVSNEIEWKSIRPSSFSRTPWSSGTDNLQHGVSLSGSPRFVFVGYLLLSKRSGSRIYDSTVKSVLRKALIVLKTAAIGCSTTSGEETLEQPIHYLRGSNSTVRWATPPNARQQTAPGFIQFRAFSLTGTPYPICPGVKTCRPQSMCLGGVNSASTELGGACGDFPGWDGSSGDSPSTTQPIGYARSLNDQRSSILIFTRLKNVTLP